MIRELINFTESIDNKFEDNSTGITKGFHLFVDFKNDDLYLSKFLDSSTEIESSDLNRILMYERYSAYLSMNKQQKFDKNQKIHSASPYCLAFNFSLGNNKMQIENELKKRIECNELKNSLKIEAKNFKIEEVKKSIPNYFINAKKLCVPNHHDFDKLIHKFQSFCYNSLLDIIKFGTEENKVEGRYLERYENLGEKDYIKIYLVCVPIEEWAKAYKFYFNSEYPQDKKIVNDFFCATYNQKKPFLIHRTASFDTCFQLDGAEATIIKQFENLAKTKPKILPNPLPIFIDRKELNGDVISIFKENGKYGYKEIIEKLIKHHHEDLTNYYLLNWFYGKDFQVIDFDYVSKFEYKLKEPLTINNLFEIQEKGGKSLKSYPVISTIFELNDWVLSPLIQDKSFKVDYFKELNPEDYKDRSKTPNIYYTNRFISYSKYRKAVYDYVYKSQRNTISGHILDEMVFNSIYDDIKYNNEYGIKEKLNIWYSLYDFFNPNQKINMVNKLKEYQGFVRALINDEELPDVTDEKFAFAAGQVIEYILSKSKSADMSYNLLEPYLQQAKCSEFKKAIANDFARYKHENFSKNFEKVAAFVLSYETNTNLKHLQPQILAGVFAKNQLFSNNKN